MIAQRKMAALAFMAYAICGCGGGGGSPSPSIQLSPATLTFSAMEGSADPAAQTVAVTSGTEAALSVPTATVKYTSGSGWLTAKVTGAAAPYQVSVQASIVGIAAGSYQATVSVASEGASNSPADIPVTLTVTPVKLHDVFYRTLKVAPVVTVNLKRQNGDGIPIGGAGGTSMIFDTRVLTQDKRFGGVETALTAQNSPGLGAVALPAGEYPFEITGTALVGRFHSSLTVAADMQKTYQTSQQNWSITSTGQMSRVTVEVYQADASGKVDWGTEPRLHNPLVLSVTKTLAVPAATATVTTELFKGNYVAVVYAVPSDPTRPVAPFVSGLFAAAGDGATETPPAVSLSGAGNVLVLSLIHSTAPAPLLNQYEVEVYDPVSTVYLGTARSDAQGKVSLLVGSATSVFATLWDANNFRSVGARTFTGLSPTFSSTWTRFDVTGTVRTASGASLPAVDANARVVADIKYTAGPFVNATFSSISVAPGLPLGTYSLQLFEGSYELAARDIDGFPAATPAALSVTANANQPLTVDVGGVVTGRIQDQSKKDLQGVAVRLTDPTTGVTVASGITDATGVYQLGARFGTYNLVAGGALTLGLSLSSSAPTMTKNITRFSLNGRITDPQSSGIAATIFSSADPGVGTTASNLGVYQVNLFEGLNWLWFAPPTASLGYQYEGSVLINATTVQTN